MSSSLMKNPSYNTSFFRGAFHALRAEDLRRTLMLEYWFRFYCKVRNGV